jgi:hypothetical protein
MKKTWVSLCALFLSSSVALAGINSVSRVARPAELGIDDCAKQYSGKPLIDCVAGQLDGFGSDLVRASSQKAPQASPAVKAAAAQLRAAPNKAAAISVLNRARSVMQGLAAKSSGDTQLMYTRINRAYARALSAVNKKG